MNWVPTDRAKPGRQCSWLWDAQAWWRFWPPLSPPQCATLGAESSPATVTFCPSRLSPCPSSASASSEIAHRRRVVACCAEVHDPPSGPTLIWALFTLWECQSPWFSASFSTSASWVCGLAYWLPSTHVQC